MLYGLILECVRNGIILTYGSNIWKRIVHEVDLPTETFDLFTHYPDDLMLSICDCLVDILHDGTRDTYLEYFGQDLFRQFQSFGYHKFFRIAGRTLREFLFAIDQLHDSNRYTFPDMQSPLFHVTEEDHMGTTLEYKSARHGLIHYAKGSLLGTAKTLFKENDARIYIRNDLSTKEYTHVVFWLEFNNRTYHKPNLLNFPQLPDVASSTFFGVFPFSILMDCSLRIHRMGRNLEKLFPADTVLTQRPLDEVFRLIRPHIHVEWDKLLSYGRHIVFLLENRLPLRIGSGGRIRLKGQMKHLEDKNMLWFLCHPVLGSADDMISAGLHLTDLNLFDSASELLINSMPRAKEIEDVIEKEKICSMQIEQMKSRLLQCRKHHQDLLCTIVPKHIASMMQSGIPTYSFCEAHPLITVMFAYIPNFELTINDLEPTQGAQLLNEAIRIFGDAADKYDACRIKTKSIGSWMIVAGLYNRANLVSNELLPLRKSVLSADDFKENNKNSLELNAAVVVAYLSLEIRHAIESLINPMTYQPFDIKIGFHTGSAIGGMIGEGNSQYCLFGDAVTTAKQMMDTGEVNHIHISQVAYHHLATDDRFVIERCQQTNDKNANVTYWLRDIKRSTSTLVFNKTSPLLRCSISGRFF